jgi:prepilin-type processing-associated H-X9-DG protein
VTRDGIFFQDSKIRLEDVTDGTSNSFLFGERFHYDPEFDRLTYPSFPYPIGKWGTWTAAFAVSGGSLIDHMLSTPVLINYQMPPSGSTGEINDRLCAFGSGHPGGANFAFADGSVRFLSDQTRLTALQAPAPAGNSSTCRDESVVDRSV